MLIAVIVFILWLLLMLFLRKSKMYFFVFLLGSAGLFGFLMFIGLGIVEGSLERAVTSVLSVIGRVTGLYSAYPQFSMISLTHKDTALTFFLDYECSGYIEMLVYFCLLVFFPVYSPVEKVIYTLGGIVFIFFANVFRVFTICLITKAFGSDVYFFSHTIFARIVFYALMVVLYYFVFTRPHVKRQKVGNMSYAE